MFKHLERKADANLVCIGGKRQQTVVIPFTPTKARAMAVKCHTGDDGKVYLVIRLHGEELANRFHYAKGSTLQGIWCIYAKFKFIAHHLGQKYTLAHIHGIIQKEGGIYLARQWMVKQDRTGSSPKSICHEAGTYLTARLFHPFGRTRRLQSLYPFAYLRFLHHRQTSGKTVLATTEDLVVESVFLQ